MQILPNTVELEKLSNAWWENLTDPKVGHVFLCSLTPQGWVSAYGRRASPRNREWLETFLFSRHLDPEFMQEKTSFSGPRCYTWACVVKGKECTMEAETSGFVH